MNRLLRKLSTGSRRLDLFFLICLIVSLILLGMYLWNLYEVRQAEEAYRALQEEYQRIAESLADEEPVNGDTTIPVAENGTPEAEAFEPKTIRERYLPLLEINEDVVGWIRIDGTVIDYPVVQGDDNEHYLKHSYTGEPLKSGAIFMDFRNQWETSDNNLILYGHTLTRNHMFADLNFYVDKNVRDTYMKDHGIIELETLYEDTRWEIFSAYVVELTREEYYLFPRYSETNFPRFIEMANRRTLVDTGIQVTPEDQLLTLVTCWPPGDDARTIIHARRIPETENSQP